MTGLLDDIIQKLGRQDGPRIDYSKFDVQIKQAQAQGGPQNAGGGAAASQNAGYGQAATYGAYNNTNASGVNNAAQTQQTFMQGITAALG